MKIYNTATRQVEEFQPLHENKVKLYTCGPTVYDFSHIGNLRAYVFDDTLRRTLQNAGYNVAHVMNITDVGHLVSDEDEGADKLEKGAEREQKTVYEVADYYIRAFKSDVSQLNILEPNAYKGPQDNYARATDFISQQIELISLLLQKGYAYQTPQAIYFNVSKLADYGKLTGQKLGDKETAAREEVITDAHKINPQDFAVWFFKVGRFANHTMHWDSPWGAGFPGWHLECSAIIHATLAEPIDIHTGGVDHIGTHHTNEIAQTEAGYGHQLAKYWVHNEHLLIDGQKMSKSKNNFATLKDITQRGFDPKALRLLFLQAHYRSQMNFTWDSIAAAQKNLTSWQSFADLRFQANEANPILENDLLATTKTGMLNDLLNDLSSPSVIAKLEDLIATVLNQGLNTSNVEEFKDFLKFINDLLGIDLLGSKDITPDQKELISNREAARNNSDWATSDKIRDQLREQGIELNDTPGGTLWWRNQS